jgi:hypothetical protein
MGNAVCWEFELAEARQKIAIVVLRVDNYNSNLIDDLLCWTNLRN